MLYFINIFTGISTVRALCTCVVLVGLFITTEPQIWGLDAGASSDEPTPSTASRILWPFCFAIGFLPIGLSNVFCEKELKKNEVYIYILFLLVDVNTEYHHHSHLSI